MISGRVPSTIDILGISRSMIANFLRLIQSVPSMLRIFGMSMYTYGRLYFLMAIISNAGAIFNENLGNLWNIFDTSK